LARQGLSSPLPIAIVMATLLNHYLQMIITTMDVPVPTPPRDSAPAASAVLESALYDSILTPSAISDPVDLFGSHYDANGGTIISLSPSGSSFNGHGGMDIES